MKVDHGKIAAAGRERGGLLPQHPNSSADQGRRHAAGAEAHGSLVPGTAEGDAGRDARVRRPRTPSSCSTARISTPGRAPKTAAPRAGRSSTARWWSAPGTGDIQTKEIFGDVQLHVEWCDPQLPPDKVNQDRGNSGVFLQDVYEVQVLDNFENKTYVNGMVGSIYKQFPPLVNAASPPSNWQTYDIIFTAPRFAADGSLASPARLTVLLQRRAGAEQRRRSRAALPTSARPATSRMATCRCACRITGTWSAFGTSGCASSELSSKSRFARGAMAACPWRLPVTGVAARDAFEAGSRRPTPGRRQTERIRTPRRRCPGATSSTIS